MADAGTGLVRRLTVDSAGTVTNDETIAEDFGTFSTIQGIAATAGGDVLFADNIGSVYKITSAMTLPVTPTTPGLALAVGVVAEFNLGHIALDASGNIYTSNFGGRIVRINPAGTVSADVVDLGDTAVCDPSSSGSDDQPAFRGLAFAPDGDLVATGYCTDNGFVFPGADIDTAFTTGTPIITLPSPYFENPSSALDGPDFNGPFGVVFWDGANIQHACRGLAATIVGTPGPDVITGTTNNDVIVGLGGSDSIHGDTGDDLICGGPGADNLYGDAGHDTIYGNGGADVIHGGPGVDWLFGNGGADVIKGHGGRDRIFGNVGDDTLYGGGGRDRVFGGPGNDDIYGQGGRDRLFGGPDDDNVYGGNGADIVRCGAGTDFADGGLPTSGPPVDTNPPGDCESTTGFPLIAES